MCGRYYVDQEAQNERLAAIVREAARRQEALTGQSGLAVGEVFPGSVVAVLAVGKNGQSAYPMRWGFSRMDGRGLLINVRSESALQKAMFRPLMLHRRCLVPANWYFEWQSVDGQKEKIKHAIRPRQGKMFYLAGIYRYEEGQRLPALSILTREAAPGIAFIHPRMPVIFSETQAAKWLDRESDPTALLTMSEMDFVCSSS